MIDKYYNGVIEQVVSGIGNVEHNSILVRYSNDFSIWDLESVNHYKDQSDIFFTCHEFSYNKIAEAYEPYLKNVMSTSFRDLYLKVILKTDFARERNRS